MLACGGIVALAGTGIMVVCLLMTAEQQAFEGLVVQTTMAELALQLRLDCHDADRGQTDDPVEAAEPGGRWRRLTLELADGRQVTYECLSAGMDRQERRRDGTRHRNLYRLPFGESGFEHVAGESLVVWHHARQTRGTAGFAVSDGVTDTDLDGDTGGAGNGDAGAGGPPARYRVEAILGLHSRGGGAAATRPSDEEQTP
jgi:hypothetical protein